MSLPEIVFHPFADELCCVKLRQGHTPGSDYINASFVDVCSIPLPIVLCNYGRDSCTLKHSRKRERRPVLLCVLTQVCYLSIT